MVKFQPTETRILRYWSMKEAGGIVCVAVLARRSARRGAKGDAGTSVERRNEAVTRENATRMGRAFFARGFVTGLAPSRGNRLWRFLHALHPPHFALMRSRGEREVGASEYAYGTPKISR